MQQNPFRRPSRRWFERHVDTSAICTVRHKSLRWWPWSPNLRNYFSDLQGKKLTMETLGYAYNASCVRDASRHSIPGWKVVLLLWYLCEASKRVNAMARRLFFGITRS
jgi:hypothetical protein